MAEHDGAANVAKSDVKKDIFIEWSSGPDVSISSFELPEWQFVQRRSPKAANPEKLPKRGVAIGMCP